jgi:hypothetical protein
VEGTLENDYRVVPFEKSTVNLVRGLNMKKSFVVALFALGLSLEASATLTPVGSYTITFTRGNWSQSKTIPVSMMTSTASNGVDFYNVNGKMTQVYMQSIDMAGDPTSQRYTWYVNSPAVKDDPLAGRLLQGSGPLTITISDLNFIGMRPDEVQFLPKVTHVYYVGYSDGYFQPQTIPGEIPVSPGEAQKQRSPILPLSMTEPDRLIYKSDCYGTPYSTTNASGMTIVLPDLYVPTGGNWEVSFGMGFEGIPNIPEPMTLLTLCLGFFGIRKKF